MQIFEKALGVDHPHLAYPLVGLAIDALAREDDRVARMHAERAVSIHEKGEAAPELLAEARFVLARALWADRRQRARARTLAEQARNTLAEVGKAGEDDLAEVEQWLAEHRGPGRSR